MPSIKRKELLSTLKSAEIVVVNGTKFAFALDYVPRHTPVVIAKGSGRKVADIIWAAQEFGLPIVETTLIDKTFFSKLKPGEEIAEELYFPVSQVMSFLYKTMNAPHFIRFVKPLRKRIPVARAKADEMMEKYGSVIELSLISLEFGKELFDSVRDLYDPLYNLRRKVAIETGVVIPEIIVGQSSRPGPFGYSIFIKGMPFAVGSAEGMEPDEFISGLISKLKAIVIKEAWQFLGYAETEAILSKIKKIRPVLYREVFSRNFSLPAFRFILRNLLKDGLPIRDIEGILEAVNENINISSDPDVLTEYVRSYFSALLCSKYADRNGIINAILLSPEAEKRISASIKNMVGITVFDMDAPDMFAFLNSLKSSCDLAESMGISPVLMVNPYLRRFIRRFIETSFATLPVVSYSEIVSFSDVKSFSVIP